MGHEAEDGIRILSGARNGADRPQLAGFFSPVEISCHQRSSRIILDATPRERLSVRSRETGFGMSIYVSMCTQLGAESI